MPELENHLNSAHAAGNSQAEIDALREIAQTYILSGNLDQALTTLETELEIHRRHHHPKGDQAVTHHNIGIILRRQGKHDAALEHFQAELGIWEAASVINPKSFLPLVADTLFQIGASYTGLGNLEKGMEYFEGTRQLARTIHDRPAEMQALQGIGRIHSQRGQLNQALGYYQSSLKLSRQLGHRQTEAQNLTNIGDVYHTQGKLRDSLKHLNLFLPILRELGDQLNLADTLWKIGHVYEQLNQLPESASALTETLALYKTIGSPQVEQVQKHLDRVQSKIILK